MNERQGLTPGHWIEIATIAVGVLGGVIGVALRERMPRLEGLIEGLREAMGCAFRRPAVGVGQ